MCSCGSAKVRKYSPPNSFLIRCPECESAILDTLGNPQPVHLVSILATREQILIWLNQEYPIEFVNPDDRALVLLEVA